MYKTRMIYVLTLLTVCCCLCLTNAGTTTSTTTTSTAAAQDCVDRNEYCSDWKDNGYCSGEYEKYMKKYCALSCGECSSSITSTTTPSTTAAQDCVDRNEYCSGWKDDGYCSGEYEKYMKEYCALSCGECSSIDECGKPDVALIYSNTESRHRIVGGSKAKIDSIPWIVGLRKEPDFIFCGASIISRKYIVTAAHCFYNSKNQYLSKLYEDIHAYAGKYHLKSSTNDPGQQRITFSAIFVHPDYNIRVSENDIAILQISETLEFNNHVKPVCLPKPNQEIDFSLNTLAVVAGWGETKGTSSNDILQKVAVPLISDQQCRSWLNGYGVTSSMLCAGFEEGSKDSCQGDSGGPLTIFENGRNVLAGIVSWGIGCAEARKPGVYTKVSHYTKWINEITGEK